LINQKNEKQLNKIYFPIQDFELNKLRKKNNLHSAKFFRTIYKYLIQRISKPPQNTLNSNIL